MRPDSPPAEASVAVASGPAGAAGAARATDGSAIIPIISTARLSVGVRVRTRPLVLGPAGGRAAIGSIVAGAVLLALFAGGRESALVPHAAAVFPGWDAGPLHLLLGHLTVGFDAMNDAFSAFMLLMLVAYGAALAAARSLSTRLVVGAIAAIHVALLLAPPMQLNDVWNYLGYARLGMVHHLNPYAHAIRSEALDPISRFATWHNLKSPYGPLFTAITYPIALLPIPAAYWTVKLLMVLSSVAFLALVWRCAQLLGRDPRFVTVFIAANPIYLFYEVAGFHNDFFMLVPMLAAVALLKTGRDRSAGAAVMVAVGVKFTAVLLLPFLLMAARPAGRRLRILTGAATATALLAALSLAVFGAHLPDVKDQSSVLTPFSITNLVGLIAGFGGGSPALLRLADVALVPVVIFFLRRRGDWIAGVGWSTIGLICTLSWVMPWYVVWVLPLAALGASVPLRRATLALTVFLVLTFLPYTGTFMNDHGIDLLSSPVGQASQTLQAKLAGHP
jgi:hypothetical protein